MLDLDEAAESVADAAERVSEPVHAPFVDAAHLEPSHLHRHHGQAREPARGEFERREIHEPEVAAIPAMAGDALVVVDEIAAAVENEPVTIHLDGADVMRRVPVDEIDTTFDQPMGKLDKVLRDIESPVGAPVNRNHRDVARLLHGGNASRTLGSWSVGEPGCCIA